MVKKLSSEGSGITEINIKDIREKDFEKNFSLLAIS